MNCYELQDNISAYIEKSLTIKQIKQFDDHLKKCPNCREIYDGVVNVIASLRSSKQITASNTFNAKLQDKIRRYQSKTPSALHRIIENKSIFGFEPKYAFASIVTLVAIIILVIGLIPTNETSFINTPVPLTTQPQITKSFPSNNPLPKADISPNNFATDLDKDSVDTPEFDKKSISDYENRIKLVKDKK